MTTSSSVTETVNAIEEVYRVELTSMPIFPGWTMAKQSFANPCEFEDLKYSLQKRDLILQM